MNYLDIDSYAKSQAEIFEKSVEEKIPSSIFVKRYMHSFYAGLMDEDTYIISPYSDGYVYMDIKRQINSSFGQVFDKEAMRWAGYMYRYLVSYLGFSSKKVYKNIPLSYMINAYRPYHS